MSLQTFRKAKIQNTTKCWWRCGTGTPFIADASAKWESHFERQLEVSYKLKYAYILSQKSCSLVFTLISKCPPGRQKE